MALSEKEQRLLEQMEAALAAEDPRLANALRGSQRRWYQRRIAVSVVVFVVGVATLIIGMEIHPLVSVLGFVVMLGATVVAITAWQQPGGVDDPRVHDPKPGGKSERDFTGHPDERRRRRDDDPS
ncbi:DUF3040 domain-containing protein [Propionicimonas sp.]|uniref:DUF3040 domain-containing protein n=1 Tax=Propionicimonas sp. TaxID=1955623 RepID=UPI00180C9B64|nr:DUF3040 domain-containing protein [Propionicimonas sp.]MBU3977652.1 DUF3040 domain-containing protein [Actinomycetota bacterium]MBA3021576.1 DUF3040 domain-containing protein [Propionicimonas sp.]MBU3987126.1 DUF3040 domain-containing protein [Actinomycetota bacterium]MBU4008947.1 DUF3040 domain-containing protein [Actinomycetota bacterium]MBU4065903.1 DUF3040 domain-containing protein [Actinomycetota bacterium]